MNRLESLACCRLTEVPRLGTEPGAVGHRESHLDPAAWLAPALAPSLTGAYAAGQPVLVGWIRAVRSGPTRIVLGGDLAGPRPVYPPGSRAEPMPTGWLAVELDALPVWLRCAGRPDALAATPTTERPPPAGGSLESMVRYNLEFSTLADLNGQPTWEPNRSAGWCSPNRWTGPNCVPPWPNCTTGSGCSPTGRPVRPATGSGWSRHRTGTGNCPGR